MEKTLSVMGLFDEEANNLFAELSDKIAQKGFPVSGQLPHLTFGIYNDIHQEEFTNWVVSIAKVQNPVELQFNHIGFFEQGTCFVEPSSNIDLLNLHKCLHEKYDQDCIDKNCLFSLKAKSWVPHTTLAVLDRDRIADFIAIFLEDFRPIKATITKFMISEFPPFRSLCEISLNQQTISQASATLRVNK